MRAITFAAGLLGFAAIAMGAEPLKVIAPPIAIQASYLYAPGTGVQREEPLTFSRRFEFLFPGATRDNANPSQLAIDPDATILQYEYDDVAKAIKEAGRRAVIEQRDAGEILSGLIDGLSPETIDCRRVAREMVENLISSRLKVTKHAKGESHSYQKRNDKLDSLLVAKQLNSISIARDSSITSDDNEPRFTCQATVVDREVAKCGDLRIKYNPLEAQSGALKGRKAVVVNPVKCAEFKAEMGSRACNLVFQVQRCGLHYTQKAEGARVGKASTQGLADFLEKAISDELRARQNGTYRRAAVAGRPVPAAAPAADVSVYEEFKAPAPSGSGQPAN